MLQQGVRRQNHARRAVAALQAVGFAERILDDAELARRRRQAFNGGDLEAIGLRRKHQARPHGLAVDQHGAGAANAMFAAGVSTVEQKLFPQRIKQRRARLDVGRAHDTIDPELDLHHAAPFSERAPASILACSMARLLSVTATRRRYAALACRSLEASMLLETACTTSATAAASSLVPTSEETSSRNARSPTPPTPNAISTQRPSSSSATCAKAEAKAKSDLRALISSKPTPTFLWLHTGKLTALMQSPGTMV